MSKNKESLYLQSGAEYVQKIPALVISVRDFAKYRCPCCGSDHIDVVCDDFDFNSKTRSMKPRIIYRCNDCYAADYIEHVGNVDKVNKNTTEEEDKKEECKPAEEPPKEYFIDECKALNEENYKLRKLVRILLEKVE